MTSNSDDPTVGEKAGKRDVHVIKEDQVPEVLLRRYALLGLSVLLPLLVGSLFVGCTTQTGSPRQPAAAPGYGERHDYEWTPGHMHVGVRWQPFDGRPKNNAFDAARPVIAEDSSYAQFWVSWNAAEPAEANTDYDNKMSAYLRTIEQAVDACVAEGVKVEFVFWHCPKWASISGNAGGWEARPNEFKAFAARIARHFKGRVHAYQLSHESNLKGFREDGNIDMLMSEIFTKGAQAIREVYDEAPSAPVIISTSGCSPCDACESLPGLKGSGAVAVHDFYDQLSSNKKLMKAVDALNLNVSDHFDGYGNMEGSYVPTVWANYDLVRRKLDERNYPGKKVMAAESWVVWDDAKNAMDVNGDGLKNEVDAYSKTLTIMGKCLERGLNTMNLPWSDNSSGWAMGLTKRRDYNGRIKALRPDIVIPSSDGGADVVTQKIVVQGKDDSFKVKDGSEDVFTIDDYINPADPNHLHYYIWKWFGQIAGGADEVIRHAMAGEIGNDITVWGLGYTGSERYRLSSFNRTKDRFTVLIYSSGASGTLWTKVAIPSTIQNGTSYNNKHSRCDFRGEGFADGDLYYTRTVSKDISMEDGSDVNRTEAKTKPTAVVDGTLAVTIGRMNKFTKIEFIRAPIEGQDAK